MHDWIIYNVDIGFITTTWLLKLFICSCVFLLSMMKGKWKRIATSIANYTLYKYIKWPNVSVCFCREVIVAMVYQRTARMVLSARVTQKNKSCRRRRRHYPKSIEKCLDNCAYINGFALCLSLPCSTTADWRHRSDHICQVLNCQRQPTTNTSIALLSHPQSPSSISLNHRFFFGTQWWWWWWWWCGQLISAIIY